MKPELKALWQAILDTPIGDPDGIHWRGDELWCGPFKCGWIDEFEGSWMYGIVDGDHYNSQGGSEARLALMSAVQDQINEWFKE